MRLPSRSDWLSGRGRGDAVGDHGAPEVVAARTALRVHLDAARRPGLTPRARDAVRALCDDAHRRELRAEQLLVAVKSAWRSLSDAERDVGGRGRSSTLDRFISLCIEEFYAGRD